MITLALLTSAFLFGGMTIYSFGFAPLIFAALPMEAAGRLMLFAFPYYYLFVIFTAALAAVLLLSNDLLGAVLMAATAGIAFISRQILMPIINFFKDREEQRNFNRAHFLTVALNTVQILAVAAVLVRFV